MNREVEKIILEAVQSGSLRNVKNTLEKHKLVKDESFFDYELLKAALKRKNNHSTIEFLIKEVDCRVRNPNKKQDITPLHLALYIYSNKDIIKALLAKGASIYDKNNKNETVLYVAFKQLRHRATDILLDYCGMKDLNPADEDDVTHFYIACVRSHLSAIKLYLAYGFDVNSPLNLDSSKYMGLQPQSYIIHNRTYVDLPENKWYYYGICEDPDLSDTDDEITELTEWESLDSSDTESDDSDLFNNKIRMVCRVHPGYNPLHFAVKYGFEEVVELLLTYGADCNKRDKNGRTPLHLACLISECKRIKIIEMLLKYKACPTIQDNDGETPIHIAFYNKNKEKEKIFDALLSKVQWGSINCTDQQGLSHFHIACTRSNLSTVNDFLNSGITVDHCVVSGAYKGYAALHFAALHNQKEVVELLLKRKAHVNIKVRQSLTSLHIACGYIYEKFSEWDCDYDNPINDSWILINRSNQLDIIKLLIVHGADVDAKDDFGKSPLHYACFFYGDNKSDFFKKFLVNEISIRMEEIIKIFFSKKENGNDHKINQSSILHILSEKNRFLKVSEKLVKYLVTTSANLCAFDDTGLTPLHIAVKSGNKDLVQLLLKYGANVNAKSKNSMIPLQIAIQNFRYLPQHQDIIYMLLENGSDVNIKDKNGKTMLQAAITCNNKFAFEKLLHYGADINHVENLSVINFISTNALEIILIHVQKLLTLGLHVSDKVQNDCNQLYARYSDSLISFKNLDICGNCMKELNRMKLEKIDSYTSLYSILLKDPHKLSKHAKNSNLVKIIMGRNIEEKFPLYGYLLKIQLKKGIIRSDVLKFAAASLNHVIHFSLPDSCCDLVLRHLTNEEIANLNSAIYF